MIDNPTKAQREAVAAAIANGAKDRTAAAKAKLPPGAMDTWMGNGQHAPKGHACRLFRDAVLGARADYLVKTEDRRVDVDEQMYLRAIDPDSDWKAAAWYLERVHGYNKTENRKTEISGPDGGPVVTASSFRDLTTDELRALAKVAAEE